MMAPLRFGSLMALLLLTGTQEKADVVKQDTAQLQGSWTVVSVLWDGQRIPLLNVKKKEIRVRYVFAGNKVSCWTGNEKDVSVFRINPATTPKHLDLTPTEGRDRTTAKGVYPRPARPGLTWTCS